MPCTDPVERSLVDFFLLLTTRFSLDIHETRHLLGYPTADATECVRLLLNKGRPPLQFERERMQLTVKLSLYTDRLVATLHDPDAYFNWLMTLNEKLYGRAHANSWCLVAFTTRKLKHLFHDFVPDRSPSLRSFIVGNLPITCLTYSLTFTKNLLF